eukprot:COSAG02_NODE_34058_length_490_cov_0.872123_1_plen_92_part_00
MPGGLRSGSETGEVAHLLPPCLVLALRWPREGPQQARGGALAWQSLAPTMSSAATSGAVMGQLNTVVRTCVELHGLENLIPEETLEETFTL